MITVTMMRSARLKIITAKLTYLRWLSVIAEDDATTYTQLLDKHCVAVARLYSGTGHEPAKR